MTDAPPAAEEPAGRFRPAVRVHLAHNDQAWADSAREQLEGDGTTVVVGRTGGGTAAWEDVARALPEVVVLATGLPGAEGLAGLALCRRITDGFPGTAVVLVAADAAELDGLADAALDAGALGGVVAPHALGADLPGDLRSVVRGGALLPSAWAAHALAVYRALDSAPAAGVMRPTLADAERAVLELLTSGIGDRGAARELREPTRWVQGRSGSAWRKLVRFRDDVRLTTS